MNRLPWALQEAGFLTLPVPGALELARLTQQVARNNHVDRPEKSAADDKLFAFLYTHIKHVIYIVKENKTWPPSNRVRFNSNSRLKWNH